MNHKLIFRITKMVILTQIRLIMYSFHFIYPTSVIVPPADFPVSQPVTSGQRDCQLKHK